MGWWETTGGSPAGRCGRGGTRAAVRGSPTLAVAPKAVWKLGDAGFLSAYVFGVSCLVSGETTAKAQYHSTTVPTRKLPDNHGYFCQRPGYKGEPSKQQGKQASK